MEIIFGIVAGHGLDNHQCASWLQSIADVPCDPNGVAHVVECIEYAGKVIAAVRRNGGGVCGAEFHVFNACGSRLVASVSDRRFVHVKTENPGVGEEFCYQD